MAQKEYDSMMGLLKDEYLAEIFNYGSWHRFENLQEVLDKMDRQENGEEDKHSIPDVYGRAIQLRISMETLKRKSDLEAKYLITREILNWRGILTMIALQDLLHLEVSFEKVTLAENEKAFDEALKYAPKAEIPGIQEGWGQGIFYIIKLKGDSDVEETDIALFSPMTIVYPVADLGKKMPVAEEVSWFDYTKRKFLNPAEVLTKTEKTVVCVWLEKLQEILTENAEGQDNESADLTDILLFHLNNYQEELRRGLLDNEWMKKKCFKMDVIDAGFTHSNDPIINKILNNTVKLQQCFENDKKAGYDDIFSEQIYYVKRDESPFRNCKYNEKCKITGTEDAYAFLPIGKKMIDVCSKGEMEALVNHLEMKWVDNKGSRPYIQVNLFLSEVSDLNVDVEKKYYLEEEAGQVVEEVRDFPVMALWPPEYYEECKKYYIYLYSAKKNVKVNLDNMVHRSNNNVWQTGEFPYAISLKREDKYDIGMIFPEHVEEKKENRASIFATVGIDFGTSGTTVYAKLNEDNIIFPINICENEPKLLTSVGEIDKDIMSDYFIAENRGQNELYSVYRRSSEGILNDPEPVLDGIIYQAREGEMLDKSEYFMSDIKWENPNNGAYYQVFIEELCLHVWQRLRLKGVTDIKWRYALPLSIKDKDIYREMWKKKIKPFLTNAIQSVNHEIRDKEYSESEAASLYFLYADELKAVNKEKGYMVVDIGGGSTDIAVWQKGRDEKEVSMKAQISVPIAGRLLFTRWLLFNIKEISQHVFRDKENLMQQMQKVNEIAGSQIVINFLERVVNIYYDDIIKEYRKDSEWAERLRRQLEFGMALMFFSMGSLVGHLQELGGLQVYIGRGNFCIALGGNGSKILRWTKQKDKMLKMFQAGIESRGVKAEDIRPELIDSQRPKEEVAYGLLQESVVNSERKITDLKENVTDSMAVKWNNAFVKKYNEFFGESISANNEDICNIMSNVDRNIDVCNFFMNVMYDRYYRNILIENQDRI